MVSKKKDQEKFDEYSINTNDAWEIDDGTATLKMFDNDDLEVFKKRVRKFLMKSSKQNNF